MRLCNCNCGTPLDGRRRSVLYVDGSHRQRAYRRRARRVKTTSSDLWSGYRRQRRRRPEIRESTT